MSEEKHLHDLSIVSFLINLALDENRNWAVARLDKYDVRSLENIGYTVTDMPPDIYWKKITWKKSKHEYRDCKDGLHSGASEAY